MLYEVEIQPHRAEYRFGAVVRHVHVPDAEVLIDGTLVSIDDQLDAVFRNGQNDFQPLPCPSVSIGDVIACQGGRYLVVSLGFERLPDDRPAREQLP